MQSTISTMHLETERLIIRPYAEVDLMESFELMQNPKLFTWRSRFSDSRKRAL